MAKNDQSFTSLQKWHLLLQILSHDRALEHRAHGRYDIWHHDTSSPLSLLMDIGGPTNTHKLNQKL